MPIKACEDPKCRYYKMAQGDPTAFMRVVSHYICPDCAQKQLEGQLWCPNCKKWYVPKYPNRAMAPEHDKEAIEQWITGLCSTECWKKYLGVEE